MFLDQSTSPAIIAHGISILYHEDILNIIYLLRDNSAETIMKVLKYYFPEVGNFELEEVKKNAIRSKRRKKRRKCRL